MLNFDSDYHFRHDRHWIDRSIDQIEWKKALSSLGPDRVGSSGNDPAES